uniref:Uncharacterized protein n=1 Tax=uncultured marine group II/III euryarchaeote KM3_36_F10 TaxID=1456440 RepID=A0A075GZN8_9EURY|nr:hypothetical protein [uncultured marine group II/III euryarchaeote KM3_36_F10]
MRTAALLQTILMISSVLLVSVTVFGEDSETVISDNVTWTGEDSVEGAVRIVDGGYLLIENADIKMMAGSSIHIDEGGGLTIWGSTVKSQTPPTAIASMGYWDEDNISRFKVPGDTISGPFQVEMVPMDGDIYYGDVAHIGDEIYNLNGSSHTFNFDEGTEDIWIGLTGYGASPVSVGSITITTQSGSEITTLGSELESVNMRGAGTPGFEIHVEGEMSVKNSALIGAQVFVDGELSADDATFDRVGPILVGDAGKIDLWGSSTSFSGSLDDHDIRAGPYSDIIWPEGVSGSGGLIDKWERRISGQTLHLDAKYVILRISGLGPQESDQEIFSDENGTAYINGGNERVVEIGYADGTVWTESATIEIISYETGWNPQTSGIGNYGGGVVNLSWSDSIVLDSGTPYVEWEYLEIPEAYGGPLSDSSKNIGQSMPVLAGLANRGTVAALLYFTCDNTETGMEADIGGYQQARIDPGESVEVSFGWRHTLTGEASLTCRILTPTQLVEDGAFGGGSMTTYTATWTEPVEDDSLPVLPLLAAIIVAMAIAGATMLRRASDAIVEDGDDSDYSKDEN